MNLERHVLGLNHERLFPIYAFFDVTFPSGVYEFSFLCVCVCVCVCVFLYYYYCCCCCYSDTCCSLGEELELSIQFLPG